ncbi:GNAT family N-acetyltransferase [Hyphomicrobium methylovorum]|uniref:GNAT family N-acetyltransferase n=1 Tax=Hyphomicrobium methylovorum TaxID=84 RepID=UPI0015E6CA03|nr:GNAT family N-acetyltransferase [Hyphomicrobium methylovorum]MBA2125251.1 GNAT family N-acetyltransferase [Hyphomicrobium methylovorum]
MTIRVRPVVADDEAAWLQLFRDYVTFYEATVGEDVLMSTWQRLLAGSDNMMALIALDETGRPVGIATLVFHRSTWSPTWYCYLEDLFVAPDVRGGGVGRALIEATYQEADRRGATRTYWATQEKNAAARALYDRLATLTDFLQYRR